MAEQQGLVDRLSRRDVVGVPFRAGSYVATTSESSVTVFPPGPASGGELSPFGVPGGLLYVNAGTSPGGGVAATAVVELIFYGKFFGLQWQNRATSTGEQFIDVEIDGTVFEPGKQGIFFHAEKQNGGVVHDAINAFPIVDDLDEGPHTARIICRGGDSGNNHLILHGLYLDARYYPEPVPSTTTTTPITVAKAPSSASELPLKAAALSSPDVAEAIGRTLQSVQCLEFKNTGSEETEVVLFRNTVEVWRAVLKAGETVRYQTGARMAMGSYFTVQVPEAKPKTVQLLLHGWTS